MWRSSSWSWRSWRAWIGVVSRASVPSGSGRSVSGLQLRAGRQSRPESVASASSDPERPGSVRSAGDQLDPGRRSSSPATSARARSTSAVTVSSLGVVSRPGRAAGAGRDDELRALGRLDDQGPRRDQAGDLGVAELLQQAEDIAIDRLAPDVVAIVEVAADADGVDPRVEGRGVERDRASFAVAEDADLRLSGPRSGAGSRGRPAPAPSGPRSR